MKTAIAQGLAGGPGGRLALVGFDACLMATFEIANMLKPYAEYMLASEEVVPGHGMDYGALAALAADPSLAPPMLARKLIDGFVAQSVANRDESSITMSITHSTRWEISRRRCARWRRWEGCRCRRRRRPRRAARGRTRGRMETRARCRA